MTTFEIAVLAGPLCGIIMVCGGIMLLRVGAIKLSETAKDGEFAVQIRNDIKITTSYPALGIFVIGLLFVGLSIYMTKPDKEMPFSILGQLDVPDPSGIRIQVEPDQVSVVDTPDSAGRFDKQLHPRIRTVKVTITAAGYEPTKVERVIPVSRSVFGGQPTVNLPTDLKFAKKVDKPLVGKIEPVANPEKLPELNAAASF